MLRFFRREEHEKEKTAQAVKRSRQSWFGRVSGLFQRGSLDDEIWDELEEILISSDVGVATSTKLLDTLRQRIRDEHISDPQEALQLLKDEMVSLVRVEGAESVLAVDAPPLAILEIRTIQARRQYLEQNQRTWVDSGSRNRTSSSSRTGRSHSSQKSWSGPRPGPTISTASSRTVQEKPRAKAVARMAST